MAYIGKLPATQGKDAGPALKLDDISSNFNGTKTVFDLTVGSTAVDPHVNNIAIYLSGVYQIPGSAFSLSGSQVVFTSAPSSSLAFHGSIIGDSRIMTPDNNTIEPAALTTDTATSISGSWRGALSGSLNIISGSSISTGSFGRLTLSASLSASATSTGSFGAVNVGGMTNSNLLDVSSSVSSRTRDLETDSGSFSTRVTVTEASGALLDGDGTATFSDITVTGTITAQQIQSEFVSASITLATGSNIFGDNISDSHQFTGSILQSGSFTTRGNVTGSATSTGSFGRVLIGEMGNSDLTVVSSSVSTRATTLENANISGGFVAQTVLSGSGTLISGSALSTGSFGHIKLGTADIGGGVHRISLSNNDSGTSNTIFGKNAGLSLDAGSNQNVFIGENVSDATMNDALNNTAVGFEALSALTEGDSNTVVGYRAGKTLTTGDKNIAIGYDAMNGAATTGNNNIAIGSDAGDALTSGKENVFMGEGAGGAATTSSGSVFIGAPAGSTVTTGNHNIAVGYDALNGATTTGDNNIAIGVSAGDAITSATKTVAIGFQSGTALTSGAGNVLVGDRTLATATITANNVAIGGLALRSVNSGVALNTCVAVGYSAMGDGAVTTGANGTVAIGYAALNALTSGASNIAIGHTALTAQTDGTKNIAIGEAALTAMDSGEDENIAIGYLAGDSLNNASCVNNVLIGSEAGRGGTGAMIDCTVVGRYAMKATVSNAQTGTTAIGSSALTALTSGAGNTAVGYQSQLTLTTGNKNTSVGYGTMSGSATAGASNTAVGYRAGGGFDIANSDYNVFVGATAGGGDWASNASSQNVAIGSAALAGALNGANNNVAIGNNALTSNTTGDENVIIGAAAGDGAVDVDSLVIVGFYAGTAALTSAADGTVLIGASAGAALTTGAGCTAVGFEALKAAAAGANYNTALGYQSAYLLPADAEANTALGYGALSGGNHADCDQNVCIGYAAGDAITTGDHNVIIGSLSDPSAAGANNQIVIGKSAVGQGDHYAVVGNSDTTRLYASDDAGATVYGAGQSWSDKRIKENVKDIGLGLDFINKIEPIQYTKKQPRDYEDSLFSKIYPEDAEMSKLIRTIEPTELSKIRPGLIAQDVLEVLEELGFNSNNSIVQIDEETTQHSMDYSAIVVPLIKAVQELSAKIEHIEKNCKCLEEE